MSDNALILNEDPKSLVINDNRSINKLASPKAVNLKNAKGVKKYYSYMQSKALYYMSDILTKRGETVNCFYQTSYKDEAIKMYKENKKNSLFSSLKAALKSCDIEQISQIVLFVFTIGAFSWLLNESYDDVISVTLCIFFIITSMLALMYRMHQIITDFIFVYKTGYSPNVFSVIKNIASQTVSLTNKSIYVSRYEEGPFMIEPSQPHEEFVCVKYDYRDIHYVELTKDQNDEYMIKGTGFDRRNLFNIRDLSNDDTNSLFLELQKNVSDASKQMRLERDEV